jgi:hypothetical protein
LARFRNQPRPSHSSTASFTTPKTRPGASRTLPFSYGHVTVDQTRKFRRRTSKSFISALNWADTEQGDSMAVPQLICHHTTHECFLQYAEALPKPTSKTPPPIAWQHLVIVGSFSGPALGQQGDEGMTSNIICEQLQVIFADWYDHRYQKVSICIITII